MRDTELLRSKNMNNQNMAVQYKFEIHKTKDINFSLGSTSLLTDGQYAPAVSYQLGHDPFILSAVTI